MPDLASATLLVFLSSAPRIQRTPAFSHLPALAHAPRIQQNAPAPRDSFKNGALIGFAAGGVMGALGGAYGCGSTGFFDESGQSKSCSGSTVVGAMIGGLIGAGIGVGIDAMFDRAPSVPGTAVVRRHGVRLHFRF